MEARTDNSEFRTADRVRHFFKWFFHAAASILGVIGLVMITAAFDDELLENEHLLRQADPVLGFSTRTVLTLTGALHLGLSGVLFISRALFGRALIVLWLSSVFAIYGLGLRWSIAGASCPVVVLCAHKVGMDPKFFASGWGLLIGGMAAGALFELELERRYRKQLRNAQFVKNWRESREKVTVSPPSKR